MIGVRERRGVGVRPIAAQHSQQSRAISKVFFGVRDGFSSRFDKKAGGSYNQEHPFFHSCRFCG